MRLSNALFKIINGRQPRAKGNIWIGKHRIPPCVYPENLERLTRRLQIEEQNLFYLRHPYLTKEQEHGHGEVLQKHERWTNTQKMKWAALKCKPSVRMEDRLGHLNSSSNWEV